MQNSEKNQMSDQFKQINTDNNTNAHTTNTASSSSLRLPSAPSTHAINAPSSKPLPVIQSQLIKPDTIKMTSTIQQISIKGINFNIHVLPNQTQKNIFSAADYLLKIAVDPISTATTLHQLTTSISQLLALGNMITFALPLEIKQLVKASDLNLNQLKLLSSRNGGYPLPYAQLIGRDLILSNGLKINLPSSIMLPSKQSANSRQISVLPSVHFSNKKWQLTLKPIITETDIKLSFTESSKKSAQTLEKIPLLQAKPEIARLYTLLVKPLEKISMKDPSTSMNSPNASKPMTPPAHQHANLHQNINTHLHTEANSHQQRPQTQVDSLHIQSNVKPEQDPRKLVINEKNATQQDSKQTLMLAALNKAFGKAGSLPIEVSNKQESQHNLATLLNKLIPQLTPSTLVSLTNPNKIQSELIGQLQLSSPLDMKVLAKPLLSHMSSLSMLFHLLLGVKESPLNTYQENNKITISQITLNYFQKLQQKAGTNHSLLSMLDKAGTTEAVGKLVSNLNLYAQASGEMNGSTNWYFTLPYSFNQHQDNLEGHFTQETNSNKSVNWKLQLKFNLLQGPILIKAQVNEARLNMTINAENTEQLKKINSLLPPLIKKLSDIGLTPEKVSTQYSKLPASLLPGDHFLVKIKA
ncbi:hypothetical protein HQQ94_08965 [Shewanella sp. VB17]|uniref:hypothetical protein n=1 Tax=Shewanella sp. VB17 TaxID=2739432 RepID=UPI0015636C93|nr:hypothetical protein [Shewanella sp. VB17]NRD73371.1 hypothetical protein [Shewanella sp. VB17]